MNKLYIVRGLPGAGKSTFAKKLLQEGKVQQHLEADEFMTNENGDYKFDPTILQKCHQQCQMWVKYYRRVYSKYGLKHKYEEVQKQEGYY